MGLRIGAYTDEGFADAIAGLRAAREELARVRDAIDWNEPIRDRIDEQLAIVARAANELDRILDGASQELL